MWSLLQGAQSGADAERAWKGRADEAGALACPGRAAATGTGRLPRADYPGGRAVRTVPGCPDVRRVRAGSHHRGSRRSRGRGVAPGAAGHGRDRRAACDPGVFLPAGHRRLPRRRRRVRGIAGQLRATGQPGRRGGACRGLHAHRRGLHRGWDCGADLGLPGPQPGDGADLPGRSRRDHPAQPARSWLCRAGVSAAHDGFHRRTARHPRHRPAPPAGAARRTTEPLVAARTRGGASEPAAVAEGVLRRLQRTDRGRGDCQRGSAVQAAPGPPGQTNRTAARRDPGRDAAGRGHAGRPVASPPVPARPC